MPLVRLLLVASEGDSSWCSAADSCSTRVVSSCCVLRSAGKSEVSRSNRGCFGKGRLWKEARLQCNVPPSPMPLARHLARTICQTRLDAPHSGRSLTVSEEVHKTCRRGRCSDAPRCSEAVMGNHVCCAEELLLHCALPQQRDAPKLQKALSCANLCRLCKAPKPSCGVVLEAHGTPTLLKAAERCGRRMVELLLEAGGLALPQSVVSLFFGGARPGLMSKQRRQPKAKGCPRNRASQNSRTLRAAVPLFMQQPKPATLLPRSHCSKASGWRDVL